MIKIVYRQKIVYLFTQAQTFISLSTMGGCRIPSLLNLFKTSKHLNKLSQHNTA